MKVKKIPQYNSPNELMIVVDEDQTPSFDIRSNLAPSKSSSASSVANPPDLRSQLNIIVTNIVGKFSAQKIEQLIGIDQIYIDLDVENSLVTLSWDSMAGISIECQNNDLTERIFKYLESL